MFGCWQDNDDQSVVNHYGSTFRGVTAVAAHWLGMWLPVCGLIQHGMVQLGGDRYSYLPDLALAPLIGAFISYCISEPSCIQVDIESNKMVKETSEKIKEKPEKAKRKESQQLTSLSTESKASWIMRSFVVLFSVLVVLVILSHESRWLVHTWKSDEHAFKHGLKVDPKDWRILDT